MEETGWRGALKTKLQLSGLGCRRIAYNHKAQLISIRLHCRICVTTVTPGQHRGILLLYGPVVHRCSYLEAMRLGKNISVRQDLHMQSLMQFLNHTQKWIQKHRSHSINPFLTFYVHLCHDDRKEVWSGACSIHGRYLLLLTDGTGDNVEPGHLTT